MGKIDITAIVTASKKMVGQQVFKNILLVFNITLLVKGLGFLKESIVAGEYGLSQQLDTFYIAMLIPGFISTVFLQSFKNVFIPNYVSEMKTGNNMASFQTTGFLFVTGIAVIFMVFAVLVTDIYIKTVFPGHTPEYYSYIKAQFYLLAPCILLWGLAALVSGLLNINKEFKYSSLDSVFIPITVIILVLFFKETFGKVTLAAGTLIGSFFNLLFVLGIAFKKNILHFGKPNLRNANAITMLKQAPAKASSGFLTGLIGVTDQYFAAQLAIGSIAALNYGHKIPAFITGLIIMAMGNVLLPHFSLKVLENREKAFSDLFKLLKWLFLSASVVAVIAILLSDFVVQLFFERDQFTSEDTKVVSIIQKITLIYAPFTICGMVLVNFLTSINKNAFMAWVSFGSMLANIVLDYILMKFYGIYGISICTTVIYIVRSLILLKFTINQKNQPVG